MLKKLFEKNENLIALAGGMIAPIIFLSGCFSTISYKSAVFMVISIAMSIVAALVYRLVWSIKWDNNPKTRKVCVGSNIIISILLVLLLLTVHTEFDTKYGMLVYIGIIVWACICVLNFVHIKKSDYLSTGRLITYAVNRKYLILALLVTGAIAIEGVNYPLKWDGLLYYDAVNKATLESISSLALYGHVSVTAGFIYRLFFALFGLGKYGMLMANILMLMIAVIAFYGILELVVPGKPDWQYALACLPFGVSPFLAGMAGYYSTDWFSVCLITVLVFFGLKEQWISASISAIFFCLTKEPALIAYTGLCIGLVINDFFERKSKVGDRIKAILCSVHYYILLTPYFIWFVIYKIMGHWSAGDGGFGIDISFVAQKLKLLLAFNFNWIWTLLAVVAIIAFIVKHRLAQNCWWILPIVCSNGCLLLFNIMFKTVNHPRYIDSFISLSILFAVLCAWKVVDNGKIPLAIFSMMSVVGVVSCYLCIDPLTYALFESNSVGNTRLITTGSSAMGDEAIYNKQMMWVEIPLAEAFSDAIEEKTEIVLSVKDDAVYAFNGMSQHIWSDSNEDVLYWNSDDNSRVSYADEDVDQAEAKTLYYCREGQLLRDAVNTDKNISIIYIKGISDYTIADEFELIATEGYSYRGYVITRDTVALK